MLRTLRDYFGVLGSLLVHFAWAGTVTLLLSSACTRTAEYQMGEKIEVGPYTFAVTRTERGTWSSFTTITAHFRVFRDDSAPFTSSFTTFAQELEIVDRAGNRFVGSGPSPASPHVKAGRRRSQTGEYAAMFRLDPELRGVRDPEQLGKYSRDFKLIMKNLDADTGQPNRIEVQLK